MNAKLRNIFNTLNAIVTFKVDESMSDDDFIAKIDAINLLCNLHDDLGINRGSVRRRLNRLYPEFLRRIHGKENIQSAMPLIKAFYRYIYDRSDDRGPETWQDSFDDMCCKVVNAYRRNPLIDTADYLYALDTACRLNDDDDNADIEEYKAAIDAYLEDIDNASLTEKIKKVSAYERSKHLFVSDNWEKWAEIRESLKYEDISQLDDETFILWREITELASLTELKKRAGHSHQMQGKYLQALIFTEFAKQRRLKANRKLAKSLKTLNDDLIGDIIPLKINADMSVSTLYALETIFYLRLQLAQVGWADNEPIYESLCRNRFEQIAKALTKKYKSAESLNEKIEILERLAAIGMTINSDHLYFALEEASRLLESASTLNGPHSSILNPTSLVEPLALAQKLRLEWLPNINSVDDSKIVAQLLPQANDSFVMATIGLIIDYITDEERAAVLDRYIAMVDAVIASNDTAELGNLLALAGYWNSNPTVRKRLSEIITEAALLEGISLPEKRVNAIAAEIYSKIDTITGKYEVLDNIPA